MHLLLGIALSLLGRDVAAQQFQFMPFAPRAPESLLPTPMLVSGHVASTDVDGDGHSDLIVDAAGWTRVFLRQSTGWIEGQLLSDRTLGTQPLPIDLDGDGDRDLVFVPPPLPGQEPRIVAAFERIGSAFAPVNLPWAPSTSVHAAALGNLDGDGFVDMIVATPAGSVTPSLVVVRGGAGLQFTLDFAAMPATLPYGLWPALLDADGDGDLDVLAAHAASGVRLLRNTAGTFADATGTLPPTRTGYMQLLAADLDGDGHTDCAANHPSAVDVLWGGPTGFTFVAAVAPPGARQLFRGDFDGDGDVDLLAEHSSGLDVLWNVGPRQFTATNVVPAATALRGVIDEDGDGCDDVAFTLNGQWMLRCKRRARLEDAAFGLGIAPVVTARIEMLAGDVDGDGRTDLVAAESSQITVNRALGDGAFRRVLSPSPGVNFVRGDLADLDGDGDLDLVLRENAYLYLAANDGTGRFSAATPTLAWSSHEDDLRIADVDGDGDRDLVVAGSPGVSLMRNLGAMQFAAPFLFAPASPAQYSLYVELADVDGDGDPDVITDHRAISTAAHRILRNNGLGSFSPSPGTQPALGSSVRSVRAGDFDGDGDLDLVSAGNQLSVHRNDGSGVFTDTSTVDLPPITVTTTSNVVVADLDGDGDLDVGAVHQGVPPLLLLLNDGSGRFSDRSAARMQPIQLPPFGTFPTRVCAADIDDDGDVDLTLFVSDHAEHANHLRHLRSTAVPRLGGVASLLVYSGPGFGAPGLALLGVDFARVPAPLHVPGIDGNLELDPNRMQLVTAVLTSSIGVSSVFVAVPPDPFLIGLEVWFQGAILPGTGAPGFTNAVYEVVLR